jgi:hypothetical protein
MSDNPFGPSSRRNTRLISGPPGATPSFAIGTVTTGPPGSQASASITLNGGSPLNPVLNLQLPGSAPLSLSDAIAPASGPEVSLIALATGVLNKLLAGTGVSLSYSAITGDITISTSGVEFTANKGALNGYPSLDSGGKVPIGQLPTIPESQVTNLTTDLATKAPVARILTAGDGLAGGGDLTADRSFAVDGTVIRSTDTRLSPWNIATSGIIPGGYNRRSSYDDFLGNASSTLGQLGWLPVVSGTNASVSKDITTETATLKGNGVVLLWTGNTAAGTAAINLDGVCAGLGAWEQDWRLLLSAQPSTAQNFNVKLGLFDLITGTSNDVGFWINLTGSIATMFGECGNSGTFTDSATVACPAASVFHKFKIAINAAWTSATFYADGTLIATIATNIPAAGTVLYPWIKISKSAGTTPVGVYADQYFDDYQFSV